MDLAMVGALNFSLFQNLPLWESNEINIFRFSHQIMELIILAKSIKHQVLLIHLGFFLIYEGKCL